MKRMTYETIWAYRLLKLTDGGLQESDGPYSAAAGSPV